MDRRGIQEDDDEAAPVRAPVSGGVRRMSGVAAPLPALAAGLREPDEEQLATILEFQGKVVSADVGLFNAKQKMYLAALDNGVLLVAKSEAGSSSVASARQILERQKYRPVKTYHVDLETIRKVNDSYMKRSGHGDASRGDSAVMQRAVIDLVRTAAQMRCSDIHITVGHHEAKIRVRSDGVMMPLRDLPAPQAFDLCQAAFNMADASDSTYRPMDYQGARITSIKTTLPEGVQAVRLQFNPLPDGGRYLVMRLLYSQKLGKDDDVNTLGYSGRQVRQIKRMRDKPFGINIISGPTGSGKSTTLQRSLGATLREKRYEVNVITVEDPPEYEIEGAAQLPVTNVKTDEDRREAFRAAITASLRSDPDIVMIGEIRDPASATLAFQAAMTGHQVWASLHANDAVSILDRLRDVEVETYKLTDPSLVTGLIGQRLIRRLCDACRVPWSEGAARKLIDEEAQADIGRVVGDEVLVRNTVFFASPADSSAKDHERCEGCGGRGYTGRSVVAETINPDKRFMELISAEKKDDAVRHWLTELGGMTMLEHAVLRMLMGEVDPRDVKDRVGIIDEVDADRMKAFAKNAKQSIS